MITLEMKITKETNNSIQVAETSDQEYLISAVGQQDGTTTSVIADSKESTISGVETSMFLDFIASSTNETSTEIFPTSTEKPKSKNTLILVIE